MNIPLSKLDLFLPVSKVHLTQSRVAYLVKQANPVQSTRPQTASPPLLWAAPQACPCAHRSSALPQSLRPFSGTRGLCSNGQHQQTSSRSRIPYSNTRSVKAHYPRNPSPPNKVTSLSTFYLT